MNKEKTFALLIDVDNLPLTADGVHSLINQVKAKGEIAYGKIYGYAEKKQHKGIMDIINRTGFDYTGKSRSKKSSKSMVDNRMFIDAVEIACINENIDSICVVAGDGDLVPLFAKLKELGMYVVGGFNENPDNADMCQELVYIDGNAGGANPARRSTPATATRQQPQSGRQQQQPVAARHPQQFLPLSERLARRGVEYQQQQQPVTRIGNAIDIDKAASEAGDRHQDLFNEYDKMVQDFIKENEK